MTCILNPTANAHNFFIHEKTITPFDDLIKEVHARPFRLSRRLPQDVFFYLFCESKSDLGKETKRSRVYACNFTAVILFIAPGRPFARIFREVRGNRMGIYNIMKRTFFFFSCKTLLQEVILNLSSLFCSIEYGQPYSDGNHFWTSILGAPQKKKTMDFTAYTVTELRH